MTNEATNEEKNYFMKHLIENLTMQINHWSAIALEQKRIINALKTENAALKSPQDMPVDIPSEPVAEYGPHDFFHDVSHEYMGSFYRCKCGAYKIGASSGMGCSEHHFIQTIDPLPEPHQCQLNPLPKP